MAIVWILNLAYPLQLAKRSNRKFLKVPGESHRAYAVRRVARRQPSNFANLMLKTTH